MGVATGAPVEKRIGRRRALRSLREAAAGCTACPLYADASQTVFGRGPSRAPLMLVGEQPGDREDVEGEPFVGPAGRVLDEALGEAEIERDEVYLTNAVKHFKWRQGRGKRRLHQRPNAAEVRACRPWLEAELAAVKPGVVVCLGAVAAQALLGSRFKVTRDRGTFVEPDFAPLATATIHPSAILRMDDPEERRLARHDLARDLAGAARRATAG
jgi:uracil-DNA glycosylase